MQGRLITALALAGALGLVALAVWIVAGDRSDDGSEDAVATLSAVFNDVTTLRAGQLAWNPGSVGTPLHVRDSVRTGGNARATVSYTSGLVLNVDPDSLLVITAPTRDEAGAQVQEVLVATGGVRGEVRETGAGGRQVVTIRGESGEIAARLLPTEGTGERLRYRVRMTESGATEVAVLSGAAEVEADGERVGLSAGEVVEVSVREGRRRLSAATRLPPFPESVSPSVDARLDLSAGPAIVDLVWRPAEAITEHRIQIARTFAFDDLLAETTVDGDRYPFEVPASGVYFWRVASRDARGVEGEYGFARRFAVLALPGEETPDAAEADAGDPDDGDPQEAQEEPPPSTATEVEFDFAGQVMGQGLRRQARGRGAFRPISGRVELNAQDVIRAERWGGVRLGRGASVHLDANTQVQLARAGRDGGRRVLALSLTEGSVLTTLDEGAALASVLVEADGARVTVRGDGEGSRVRTARLEDRLRVVAERGDTRIWSGGREHRVPAGHALDIPASGEIGSPMRLPGNPSQAAPAAGARFMTLDSPPEVEMRWQPVENAMAYRVRITSGNRLVYQGNTREPRLAHNGLAPGTYQWRVHAVDRAGLESVDPPARTFSVVRESRPPRVSVLSPADGATLSEEQVTVAGRTEAGVRVKVNGRDVELDGSGSFSTEVRLTPGVNHIVIEAVNQANAVTFENLRVRRE